MQFLRSTLPKNHRFCSVRVISTAIFENNQKYQVEFEGKTKINLSPPVMEFNFSLHVFLLSCIFILFLVVPFPALVYNGYRRFEQ